MILRRSPIAIRRIRRNIPFTSLKQKFGQLAPINDNIGGSLQPHTLSYFYILATYAANRARPKAGIEDVVVPVFLYLGIDLR